MAIKSFFLSLFFILISASGFAETLMVEVKVDHGIHEVVEVWTVPGNFSDHDQNIQNGLRVKLWQGKQLMNTYVVKNPEKLYSPLDHASSDSSHDVIDVEQSIFHLRLPAEDNISLITIESMNSEGAIKSKTSLGSSSPLLDYQL